MIRGRIEGGWICGCGHGVLGRSHVHIGLTYQGEEGLGVHLAVVPASRGVVRVVLLISLLSSIKLVMRNC